MNEQEISKQNQEGQTKAAADNSQNGLPRQSSPLLDGADQIAQRLEKANREARDILQRQEELYARQRLGGISDAAGTAEVKKVNPFEMSDLEFSKAIEKGTINPYVDNTEQLHYVR